MLRTRFTDLIGCTAPIQQAGLGTLANPDLAAAVADAGGLGTLSWNGMPLDALAAQLDELTLRTGGAIGVNVLVIDLDKNRDVISQAVEVAASRAKVVDFFWGEPDRQLVEQAHGKGALVSWQVGSWAEAVAAGDSGCDFVIAQGVEAGGHVRGRLGLLTLLTEVLDAVDIPVLAAGGIGTGHALAAVLASGADGARIGTRFVAAAEARAHPTYVKALIDAVPEDTAYTDTFSVGWPDAPHRCLKSSIEAAIGFEGDVVGERYNPYTKSHEPVQRFQSMTPTWDTTGQIEAMSLWAGESVGAVKSVQPAANIIAELVDKAETLLQRWTRATASRLETGQTAQTPEARNDRKTDTGPL